MVVKLEPLVQAKVTTVMSKTLPMAQDIRPANRPANLQTGVVNSIWHKTKEADAYSELGTSNDKQWHDFWHGDVILEDHASAMAPVGVFSGVSSPIYG